MMDQITDIQLGLLQKIGMIQQAVNAITKDATNTNENYGYASSVAVMTVVRAKLVELQLLCLPDVNPLATKVHYKKHIENGKEKMGFLTELHADMIWIDLVTGATFRQRAYGHGYSSTDRGDGKAMTYLEKYFFLKTLHLPTPDADPDTGQDPGAPRTTQQVQTEPPLGITHPAPAPVRTQESPTPVHPSEPASGGQFDGTGREHQNRMDMWEMAMKLVDMGVHGDPGDALQAGTKGSFKGRDGNIVFTKGSRHPNDIKDAALYPCLRDMETYYKKCAEQSGPGPATTMPVAAPAVTPAPAPVQSELIPDPDDDLPF